MSSLRIEALRGDLVESVHRVLAVVVDETGREVAASGDPGTVTYWRSAAKPFQALPLVADGGARRFGLEDRELALCAASHSSEARHLDAADAILRKIGLDEAALACGPHTPLGPRVAEEVVRQRIALSPRWSNCSGKHAGMLALARHHGWPVEGYNVAGHPVQARILEEVARWSGLPGQAVVQGIDGCNTVCFGLPLRAMALAYARLGRSEDPAAATMRRVMTAHPDMVAGTGRPCTDLMAAFAGGLVAKVGAEGVYSACLPGAGLGLALKVEDGDMRSGPIALMAVLRAVLERWGDPAPLDACRQHAEARIKNTRGLIVGVLRAAGALTFR